MIKLTNRTVRKSYLFGLAFIFSLSCLLPQLAPAALANDATYTLTVKNGSPTIGEEIEISIIGHGTADLYAYEIRLMYDPAVLKFKHARSGSAGYSVTPNVQAGHILFAHTKVGAASGESGEVLLCTLFFEAIGQGNTMVGLESVTAVNSQLSEAKQTETVRTAIEVIRSRSPSSGPVSNEANSDGPIVAQPTITSEPGGDAVVRLPEAQFDNAAKASISTIDQATWMKALEQAAFASSNTRKIRLEVASADDALAYVLRLPAVALAPAAEATDIEIVSPLGSVTLPGNLFHADDLPAGEPIELHIEALNADDLDDSLKSQIGNRPIIGLSIQAGGQALNWNNPATPVTVAIDYTPTAEEMEDPEHIVVWYIDGQGQAIPVTNGRYDARTNQVIFAVTHFSTYAIAFVQKSFEDIASLGWAKKPIEVLASKGIVFGVTERLFHPAQAVSRGDFIVLLARTLELGSPAGPGFADVKDGDYYAEAIGIARGLGIAVGTGNNLFRPRDPVTREDMIVFTYRALNSVKAVRIPADGAAVLGAFSDAAALSGYATDSAASLVHLNLVHGYGGGIHPKEYTSRAEAAALMYNLYRYVFP